MKLSMTCSISYWDSSPCWPDNTRDIFENSKLLFFSPSDPDKAESRFCHVLSNV